MDRSAADIKKDESLVFPKFTAATAWDVGTALRERLLQFEAPAVINISLANGEKVLFACATRDGTLADNVNWVRRKRAAVLRWESSSFFLGAKHNRDEKFFADKYGLGESAGQYAIHGGGFPIRVAGVDGVIGAIVVSGLAQEDDHGIIVEVLKKYLATQ